ncbi:hypothetical protein RB195_016620 [Necator americanus]|uniref:Uncharacterized protein n=1 Tax=Necator americanus TaxID=51031 RepID=A0ABR1C1D7_NECAM
MRGSLYEESLDEETRRSLRQENRNIFKTLCFGTVIFLVFTLAAMIITALAANPSNSIHAINAKRNAQKPHVIRIPQYDLMVDNRVEEIEGEEVR